MALRYLPLCVCLLGRAAWSAPDWTDTAALIAKASGASFRSCRPTSRNWRTPLVITRDADTGATRVESPLTHSLGYLGLTAEERCLRRVAAKIQLPPLPAGIARLRIMYPFAQPLTLDAWNDLPKQLAVILDADRVAALRACPKQPVRFSLVGRRAVVYDKQRCLKNIVARWSVPALPVDLLRVDLEVTTASSS